MKLIHVIYNLGVSYFSSQILTSSGLKLSMDATGKHAEYNSLDKKFAVRVGSRTGMLDGKTVDIGGKPFRSSEISFPRVSVSVTLPT